ncbi:histidine phosphatase family protein [Lactobacillus iners]|uniref:histidine phosphatase family protein n=1 Tax=Lactobacillus iners TaxID=147802 RepID=UPI0022CDBDD1|nr:histidine phosphatase family protein [Lactobacillus iners]MCZ9655325.1 histidine phosphatase family protein [Lactobacillus iners]
MVKTLYIVRHGQTFFNFHHKTQGSCDSRLTALGIRQAKTAGDYFRKQKINFDAAYCSTQERASDTLELITDHKMPYTRLKDFCEKDYGIFEGADEYTLPWNGDKLDAPSMERDDHVVERMVNGLKRVQEETEDGQNILIVAHGDIIAMFSKLYNSNIPHFSCCSFVKFLYDKGTYTFAGFYEPAIGVE